LCAGKGQDIWVGVALDHPRGTHDGTFMGKRYFQCAPLHGVVTRARKVKLLDDPPVEVGETTPA
jgi:dynactin complex subunit